MTIFFAGAIRGGRALQPEYAAIVELLSQYGTVHSPHVPDGALSPFGEIELPDEDIYKREIDALAACDTLIAETTIPSLGVGYLIAYATFLGKQVIVLHKASDTLKLSAMIRGDTGITTCDYGDMNDIATCFDDTLRN
jgi:hypothetical protein